MLRLNNIVKVYGENTATPVTALKGVTVSFDRTEFVSVLGQSGCGKTTLLNIIGGLDRYTEGDLIIDGVSTKDYNDRDWDTYRNHSVGFVFQSYNLIPHQTVIKNVELALTLSGVDKETRKKRATDALELVGLKDQINKLPNQLSGGQMQRVAIARAIVNDPEIILADEPTGALDSATSVQVMEILKELSKTRLVIMVTHNGELAEKYSTRIVTLSDGLIIGDTKDSDSAEEDALKKTEEKPKAKVKKPSMSLLTAFSLSLNNLFTKKGRTILTAFAGSIGIIGIALILSLSAGFNGYIQNVQRDTLTNYPISITSNTVDYTSALTGLITGAGKREGEEFPTEQTVTSRDMIQNLLTSFVDSLGVNDLKSFKVYLDKNADYSSISAIQYSYGLNMHLYTKSAGTYRRISPAKLPPMKDILPTSTSVMVNYYENFQMYMNSMGVISEMIDNAKLVDSQYDVLKGSWPKAADEIVVVVDQYNQISDLMLYMLGLMNDADIAYVFQELMMRYLGQLDGLTDEQIAEKVSAALADLGFEQTTRSKKTYSFEELMGLEYDVVLPYQRFKKSGIEKTVDDKPFPLWEAKTDAEIIEDLELNDKSILQGGTKLKVSGIVRLKKSATSGSLTTSLCYTKALTELMMSNVENSEILTQQTAQKDYLDKWNLLSDGEEWAPITATEYDAVSKKIGMIDRETPTSISIYPSSFEAKDKIVSLIEDYNREINAYNAELEKQSDYNPLNKKTPIKYNDYIGLMMSSITDIINAVTYVLIAFVSISLIVSSIMISVITHISVMERTKEIGVLRSIGASKRDISRVFNAETAIIGLTAGVLGILITLLLNIPLGIIIYTLSGLENIAVLPVWGGFSLVGISVLLTIIAGLVPAYKASKKDPVVALRTE